MNPRNQVLISVAELANLIRTQEPVTILDVRWRLDRSDGHSAYLLGHLPGAVYVSLEDELSDHTVAGRGRHPLPSGRSLQVAARRWGIRQDGLVVAYDDWERAGSARAWWLLTAAGIENVRILDGGLTAWQSAQQPLETGAVVPRSGDVAVRHDDLSAGRRSTLTAQQCGTGNVTLLDARAPERFRGEVEPVDPVAGHIPGAISLPSATVLACDGTFLDDDALAQVLSGRSIDRDGAVGAYCGSGITAAVIVAALAALGCQAALYPGSWSEWSSDPTRPVGRGAGVS
ncbi:sulfurtransferase [Mycobacterium attenuatum]|uniref:sulfurtransferase n=1 Tax=Mycobacterium attenuatum TaxID=2341086 RepID=UPI000F021CF9|nr:sulfurtransferase [Mycobacterium attenuatum]VBA55793.1 Putative thiosulfate sulfurtransferase SseB [Mycobacterium attenuatum]VBA59564.1 Putative thiosulfate sulfurtransferase SseB [Mycobacterium attenuatum]